MRHALARTVGAFSGGTRVEILNGHETEDPDKIMVETLSTVPQMRHWVNANGEPRHEVVKRYTRWFECYPEDVVQLR